MTTPTIPADLLPNDGRFGSGPAKIRDEAVAALAASGRSLLGTSHRQAPVRDLVGRVREQLGTLFDAPEGYEVVLGNGGATAFWDIAVSSVITHRSAHGVFGEFSSKFARAAGRAPHLATPVLSEAAPGSVAVPDPVDGVDAYCWAQNETSTGVAAAVHRVAGDDGALTIIDATSAAGGLPVDLSRTDVYYFAPQKCLGSDGGLWLAFLSPAAVQRVARIAASDRWIPDILSLQLAIENARKDQTLNTPALATLFLLDQQLRWLLAEGGLAAAVDRSRESARRLYAWAEDHAYATPFVTEPSIRSSTVGTIDFDGSVDAAALAGTLRANGIVDVEPYRKLGRNQLRIGMYPTVDPADVTALCTCIDWVIEHAGTG